MRRSIALLYLLLLILPARADYLADFTTRADLLIDQIADNYTPPGTPSYPGVATGFGDPGKYSWPKTVALMAKYGAFDPIANTWIDNAATINTFHFYFPGLAKTLANWPTAPEVFVNRNTYLQRLIDSTHCSTINYNVWTGEGTENHINMSRPAGYIFAELAVDSGITAAGGQPSPATRVTQMKDWILNWSKLVLEKGSGEWDSEQYGTYNIQGWLLLYDHASDLEVRDAARAVLDFYASTLALKYTQGLLAGPKNRGLSNANGTSATDYLCWLWFSPSTSAPSWSGNDYLPVILAALSSYRPPAIAISLAQKQLDRNVAYRNSKPSYLLTRGGETKEVTFIGSRYTLATAFDPYGGWTNASWAVVTWKGIVENSGGDPGVLWGNGGQKSTSHARGRNPYDQFVQHRNVLIQMTRVPSNVGSIATQVASLVGDTTFNANGWRTLFNNDFKDRFGINHPDNPVKDSARGDVTASNARRSTIYHSGFSTSVVNNILWLQLDGTFVAIRSIRESTPVTESGKASDSGSTDELAGLVMEIGCQPEYADLTAFQVAVLSSTSLDLSDRDNATPRIVYTSLNGDIIDVTFSTSGEWIEPDFDWNYGVEEQRVGFNTTDWIQPSWPAGEGHGRRATWSINGVLVDLNNPDWPVHGGPNLVQQDGILQLRDGSSFYQVDYSASLPVFTSGSVSNEIPFVGTTLANGDLSISFESEFGILYQLQENSGLSSGGWDNLEGQLVYGDGNLMAFVVSSPTTGNSAFYRVVSE